jgi:sulfur relay (sulfurtransferase) DsrC/TusE family protein
MKHLEKYNIDKDTFIEEMNILMFSLYRDFLRCAKKDTSVLQNHWALIRNYYNEVYQKYEHMPENEIYIAQCTGWYIKELQKLVSSPNIRRFLRELKDNENCPDFYYNLR